ncbi:uncharacterized protein [Lepeophtheirus salmonis]|uniref:uncharacterized protein n=1 Tax=Lepeophtheirus salmonis TaxID=72036 RepID=UPI001AE552DF|nr:uncharacterized protein LOC121132102 [Lepeophtheirus salmonis]
MGNCKVKPQEIADTLNTLQQKLKLSKCSVSTIIHEHLDMKKLFSKCVPCLLKPKQNQQRNDVQRAAKITQKRSHLKKKKVVFHQGNTPCHNSIKTTDYWLLAGLKKMLRGKRFDSDEEVIDETEVYFEGLDKSFCNCGIEKLEDY